MANVRKTYFLCPTWDYHPDQGPIQLGNIILSPNNPALALNGPQASQHVGLSEPTTKTNVTWSTDKFRSGGFGVWAEFLSIFGLGVNAGFEHSSSLENTFAFDSLETQEISPTQELIERMLSKSPEAVEFLDRSRLRKHLYMITGLKIAYGAKAKTTTGRSHNSELKISTNGTVTGTPMSFGPEIQGQLKQGATVTFEASSPFVFAFRLRKIIVHRSAKITQEEYTKGALFEAAQPQSSELRSMIVAGIAEQDASAEDFPGVLASDAVIDDDDDDRHVRCVRLQ